MTNHAAASYTEFHDARNQEPFRAKDGSLYAYERPGDALRSQTWYSTFFLYYVTSFRHTFNNRARSKTHEMDRAETNASRM